MNSRTKLVALAVVFSAEMSLSIAGAQNDDPLRASGRLDTVGEDHDVILKLERPRDEVVAKSLERRSVWGRPDTIGVLGFDGKYFYVRYRLSDAPGLEATARALIGQPVVLTLEPHGQRVVIAIQRERGP
jgi:hypothetical protein